MVTQFDTHTPEGQEKRRAAFRRQREVARNVYEKHLLSQYDHAFKEKNWLEVDKIAYRLQSEFGWDADMAEGDNGDPSGLQ